MVWDIERGQANDIQPLPWQTDTCIGDWHYNRAVYDRNGYKTAMTVIQTLVDVVSKNGNYMLNIPLRGNGSLDDKARKVVEEVTEWMQLNSDSIYGTRPWKIFGEGPAQKSAAQITAQGFNEGKGKPFSHEDIRFAVKGEALYATALGWPQDGKLVIKSLGKISGQLAKEIQKVEWVPTRQPLSFERRDDALVVSLPVKKTGALTYANALRILG